LANVGNVFQGYDVIRDLTFSLGLNRGGDARISYFVKGLITSRDVIYFVSMTTMFVLFTYFRLRGLMDPKSWYIKVGRYGLVFSVVLVVLYISSRYQWTQYWDVSRGKVNTIHPDTQR